MRKFYSILLLLITFTFLTTYNPSEIEFFSNKNYSIFNIKNIKITNNKKINGSDIESKITKIYGKNIFFVKTKDIKNVIKNINFLDTIEVKKKYPNTLIIKIYETEPVAILFKNNEYFLLDNGSNLIPINKDSVESYKYPHIFGKDSERYFLNFLNLLKGSNFPINKIKNYYYFQIGRWDLQLKNSLLIKLPNENTKSSVKKSIELLSQDNFKNYEVIDLRINDRIIVK